MKLQKLYSYVRQAIDHYHLIEEGDHIAIGISGGKDSLTLLYALAGLRKFYPKSFQLTAVTVDLGLEGFDLSAIKQLCQDLDVPYHIVSTQIGQIIFQQEKSSPCYLCAKMRKGALNAKIMELGCNKIAYAHHMDDVVETAFMSLIYEGRFYSFAPSTYLDDSKLTIIRPMVYVTEAEVIGFQNKYHLPVAHNPCPIDGATKREYVKQLIRQIAKDNPDVKKKLYHAIEHGKIDDWELMKKIPERK